MKLNETIGFVLLAAGVVGAGAGIAMVSRGHATGWIGLALAPLLLFVAYRNIREPAT